MDIVYRMFNENYFKMVEGCRIDTGSCRKVLRQAILHNTWSKGKL